MQHRAMQNNRKQSHAKQEDAIAVYECTFNPWAQARVNYGTITNDNRAWRPYPQGGWELQFKVIRCRRVVYSVCRLLTVSITRRMFDMCSIITTMP